jgi:hypothetical protein
VSDFTGKDILKMTFNTKDGAVYDAVPDNAFCKVTKKNPNFVKRCPIKNFDDTGKICVPELCEQFIGLMENENE